MADPSDTEPDRREFTIDELAAETRVPSRTIRFYQSKKALPPPERRGRKAIYGPEHVERLQLIGRLQDQGLTIKLIRDVLARADRGELDLADWLGLKTRLQVPWADDQPRLVTTDELRELVGSDRAGLIADLVQQGLVERAGDGFSVQSPALLQVTMRLDRAGVDLAASSEAARMLRKHLGKAAEQVSGHFLKHVAASNDLSDPERLARAIDLLRPVGLEAVRLIFAQEMDKALQAAVASGTFTAAVRKG